MLFVKQTCLHLLRSKFGEIKMGKKIQSKALSELTRSLGSKGVKKGGKPLTDELYDKVKDNSVA